MIDRIRYKPLRIFDCDNKVILKIGNVCEVELAPDEAIQVGHTVWSKGVNLRREQRDLEALRELRETGAIPLLWKPTIAKRKP